MDGKSGRFTEDTLTPNEAVGLLFDLANRTIAGETLSGRKELARDALYLKNVMLGALNMELEETPRRIGIVAMAIIAVTKDFAADAIRKRFQQSI